MKSIYIYYAWWYGVSCGEWDWLYFELTDSRNSGD